MSEQDDGPRPDDRAPIPSPPIVAVTMENLRLFEAGGIPQPVAIQPPTPRLLMGVRHDDEELTDMPALLTAPTTLPLPDTAAAVAAVVATLARRSPSPASTAGASSTRGSSGKKMSPGESTARQSKKKPKQERIKLRGRVKVTRKQLWPILHHQEQKEAVKDFADNYNLYGTVNSGNASAGYNISFDILPMGLKEVVVARKRISVVKTGEEERPFDKRNNQEQYATIEASKSTARKAPPPLKQSEIDFLNLSEDDRRTINEYVMKYDKDGNAIHWTIFQDTEYLSEADDSMEYPDGPIVLRDVGFGSKELGDILFDEFFPSVDGHAVLMDDYNKDQRSPYYTTVQNDKIKFHDPDNKADPDWIVKQCYLLLLAAAWEGDVGIENLWKKGRSGGRHNFADFGKYMPQNYFKVWQHAAPLMFTDKSNWYSERRNLNWSMFLPVLDGFNAKRKDLLRCVLLMLDESMSGWRPKTSKLGGLPNISFEPRKPVPLGTMFRNGVECFTGCLVYQDVVQNVEEQQRKPFFFVDCDTTKQQLERTSLPGRVVIQAHTAEVLRQAIGAGVVAGGWVGGDAWFGSVMSCVELMTRLKVNSTFVVKGHTFMYPMAVLHSILTARHGKRPAGHWVTMTATISGVKIVALAYAWSQKGVSYFVSTCGSTEKSPFKYQSKFEDDWGNTQVKELDRPKLAHFLYEYLPLIDEHNKQRQSILALETRWLTRDPWFRLLCTIMGMCTVDMHRLFRHHELKVNNKTDKEVDALTIIRFSDLMCGNMKQWQYQYKRRAVAEGMAEHPLCRITDDQGNTVRQPTPLQLSKGKTVGNPVVLSCFVCRRYKSTSDKQQQTAWWCRSCHMPLCNVPRNKEGTPRMLSCLEEHQQSDDPILGCFKHHVRGSNVPAHLISKLDQRKSKRKRNIR
jgi:hypothetical protein